MMIKFQLPSKYWQERFTLKYEKHWDIYNWSLEIPVYSGENFVSTNLPILHLLIYRQLEIIQLLESYHLTCWTKMLYILYYLFFISIWFDILILINICLSYQLFFISQERKKTTYEIDKKKELTWQEKWERDAFHCKSSRRREIYDKGQQQKQ